MDTGTVSARNAVPCVKPHSRVRSNLHVDAEANAHSLIASAFFSESTCGETFLQKGCPEGWPLGGCPIRPTSAMGLQRIRWAAADPHPKWVLLLLTTARHGSNVKEVLYFMPCFLQTLETMNISLCPYVIIAPHLANFVSTASFKPQATEMAPETAGGIFYYYARGTEACRGVHGRPGRPRHMEARHNRLFRALAGTVMRELLVLHLNKDIAYELSSTAARSHASGILATYPTTGIVISHLYGRG